MSFVKTSQAQLSNKGFLNGPGDISSYQYPDLVRVDTSYCSLYPYVNYEKNKFEFFTETSPNFEYLFLQMDSMQRLKDRKLNFYHIGGSHIQADIYTNEVRMFLQTQNKKLHGDRGLVFPFKLAGTNNPRNYVFSSQNAWKGYRSVTSKGSDIDMGLSGMKMTCSDSVIIITFEHNKTITKPGISKLRILHNRGEFPYELNFGGDEILVLTTDHNAKLGYTDIEFTDQLDSLDIQFARTNNQPFTLEILGFQLMNDDPGITYNSIGVNGAGLYTYLACLRFEEQLKAYPPDFMAFSLGTNDGNVPYDDFDPQVYKRNLEKMMKIALRANPKAALLLTVPNDSYFQKQYLNRNIAREREVIIELAKEYKMAVWDFYGIMGELGSSKTWKENEMMQSDFVHFTADGYKLKGELLIDSFLKYMQMMQAKYGKL